MKNEKIAMTPANLPRLHRAFVERMSNPALGKIERSGPGKPVEFDQLSTTDKSYLFANWLYSEGFFDIFFQKNLTNPKKLCKV